VRRRHLSRVIGLIVAGAAMQWPGGGRAENRVSQDGRPLHVKVDWEWVTLPASPGSAVRVCVSRSGKAYDDTLHSCRPTDLRREFRLPKAEYILGEPIVVQMFVALEGPGRWHEWVGGNYRRLGRDDNFLFLLRSADGSWVPDPYEANRSGFSGGRSLAYGVTSETPFSYWLAIQRWVALEQPGIYDLFAVHFAHREQVGYWQAVRTAIEKRYGSRWVLEPDGHHVRDTRSHDHRQVAIEFRDVSTDPPLIGSMHPELRNKLGARADRVQDFACFRITVQSPTPEEGAAMVARTVQLAETSKRSAPATQADATRQAVWFVRQDCFVPTVAGWMRKDNRDKSYMGLAMNPSASAHSLLFDELCRGAVDVIWYLPSAHHRNAIPVLISRLEDPEPNVRGIADRYLRIWTGLPFGPAGAWRTSLSDEPTHEECHRIRAVWERWWSRNSATFQPKSPQERQ